MRLDLRIEEPVAAASDRVRSLKLRIVLFGAGPETNVPRPFQWR